MSDDYFLDRRKQGELVRQLRGVPELLADLRVTLTRQARIQRSGLGKPRRQQPGPRVPFHMGAAEAADELHAALVTATRLVCEQRQIDYRGGPDDISLSLWLRRHITAVALTEGAPDVCAEICDRIKACRDVIDLPKEDDVVIDRARVREANRQVLTASQIEVIARKLGPLGSGLNKRRVYTLANRAGLRACARDGAVEFYRLGDVLDAHHRHGRRGR